MIVIKIEVLYQAIEKNTLIELRRLDKREEESCFASKFLEYNPEEKTVTIDIPSLPPGEENLKVNDRIVVKFFHKECPFSFNSHVVGLTVMELLSGQRSRVMKIALPESICGEERRDFLKVGTPPMIVDVKVITSQDFAKQLIGKTVKAFAINICGGGIALEIKDDEFSLTNGDFLEMKIHLPDSIIPIEGEVLNIYQFEGSQRMSYGIKFIQRNLDKLSFKKSVNAVIKYVMRRERELLTK